MWRDVPEPGRFPSFHERKEIEEALLLSLGFTQYMTLFIPEFVRASQQ